MLFNECILFTPEGQGINHHSIDTVLLCTLENGMSYTHYLFLGVREKLLPEACECVKDLESLVKTRDERLKNYAKVSDNQYRFTEDILS